MLARFPDKECIWPRLAGICRAHHVAMVPESHETMAESERRLPSSHATTWGFIGLSILIPRCSMSCHHCRIPVCAFCRRSEEHTSELQSRLQLVCRLLL